MVSQSLRGWLGVGAAIVVFAAAGCGSSGDDSSTSGGSTAAATGASTSAAAPETTASTSTESSGSGGAGADSVTDYAAYVGGSGKADPSKPPVYIGWVNQQGGQEVIGAAATDGAEFAVKAINDLYGGIDGRPVKLKTCFIKSAEEEGTTCAQKLGNDPDVKVIDMGGVATGIQSFYSSIDKPVITGVAATPVDGAQKWATVLFGDSSHVLGPMGTYARDVLKAQSSAQIYPNTSGVREGAQAIQQAMKNAGVPNKSVAYSQGQTDLVGPLTAAGAQSADMVIPYSDASGCVNQAKALKQLGITDSKKIVSAPLCLNPDVAAGLGGDFPLWTYSIASSLYGDPTDKSMAVYMKLADQYKIKAAPDPWVIVSFGVVMSTAKILNQVGPDASSDEILKAARDFKGPVVLGAPELQCGKYSDAPAICNDRAQFFTYAGKGKFDKAAGWLAQPND